ncbi:V-type ATP synthase subunit E [Clostridium rectalis]|uniref:V-type ATP synthase subunit E n=1 Tax=Clostridium rectalis TaxID=2040295 RepID=UPI000F63BB3E|nr:V-type ATP synthase subunit E family protein [Clostridium rectalis]
MTTINDKIKLFSKIVFDKIDGEIEQEIKSFEREKEGIINNEKKKANEYKEKSIGDISRKARVKSNEIISKAKLTRQKEILKLKDDLINEQLESITMKLKEFTKTQDYKKILYSQIEDLNSKYADKKYDVYLNGKDFIEYGEEIKKLLNENFSLQKINNDIVGGFILQDKEGTMRIDNSLAGKIYAFKENVGIKVTEAFK